MDEHALQRRERALENAFFARQDEMLLERMRAEDRRRSLRQSLAAASGVSNEQVLDELALLGIAPQSLTALMLAPMVLVAWADGMSFDERAAIHKAAQEVGLPAHPEAAALLETWLQAPPGPELATAWHDYAKAVAAGLTRDGREALRRDTIGRARRVAEAAFTFLGFGKDMPPAKREVLAILDRAFA